MKKLIALAAALVAAPALASAQIPVTQDPVPASAPGKSAIPPAVTAPKTSTSPSNSDHACTRGSVINTVGTFHAPTARIARARSSARGRVPVAPAFTSIASFPDLTR